MAEERIVDQSTGTSVGKPYLRIEDGKAVEVREVFGEDGKAVARTTMPAEPSMVEFVIICGDGTTTEHYASAEEAEDRRAAIQGASAHCGPHRVEARFLPEERGE